MTRWESIKFTLGYVIELTVICLAAFGMTILAIAELG